MESDIKRRRSPSGLLIWAPLLVATVAIVGCHKFEERRSAATRVPPAAARANFVIAVGDFMCMVPPRGLPEGTALGHEAANFITDALIKDERYQIVSADDVRELLTDSAPSDAGARVSDPPSLMKRISVRLGARVLVTGTVLQANVESPVLAARAPAGHSTTGNVIRLEAEFVNTHDGSVISHIVAMSRPAVGDLEGAALEQAIKEAAVALTREITKQAPQINAQFNGPSPGGSTSGPTSLIAHAGN